MSALAQILVSRGANVSGSDLTASELTRDLEKKGIRVHIGHSPKNVPKNCTRVVVNGAIENANCERTSALKRGIELITRETLLGEIESTFETRIAVAGTHGKSTTTAMIYSILRAANLDPTVHNGAIMKEAGSNLVLGGKSIFLTEACEFKRAFHSLNPTIAVITNIDADHLDCYRNLDEIKTAFAQFAARAEHVIDNESYTASNIVQHKDGTHSFTLIAHGEKIVDVNMSVPGRHNIQNALAAAAVGLHLKVPPQIIAAALAAFPGIARRFEILKKMNGCQIITDYAHHPNAIITTIATARSLYPRFMIVFQPHTYTRTLALFDDFVRVLGTCPSVLYKTYAAREKPIEGGTARDISTALRKKGLPAEYLHTSAELQKFLAYSSYMYDAIILTGAGDMNSHLHL